MYRSFDVETTTFAKGNAYSCCNKLVSIHVHEPGKAYSFRPQDLEAIQNLVNTTSLFVFFNAKFDIAWLRSLGVVFPENVKVYDVQLAHFYLTNQQHSTPSLEEVAQFYNVPGKVDVVKTEYWEKGIDTDAIPWNILCEYGEQDVALTTQLYELQQEAWENSPKKHTLFKLACQDLLVLQEMEWNGLYFDEEKCYEKSKELQNTIKQLTDELSAIYPGVPINFNSGHQLSAFLYGGTIKEEVKEFAGFFKGGKTPGAPKFKTVVKEHVLPRLFTPLPKTAMAAPNVFSVAEGTLRKLKGKNKKIITTLLELAKLTKLDETYYTGLISLRKEKDWKQNFLHGQFNQCVARTGRLSSSSPNLQNLASESLDIFITRYET